MFLMRTGWILSRGSRSGCCYDGRKRVLLLTFSFVHIYIFSFCVTEKTTASDRSMHGIARRVYEKNLIPFSCRIFICKGFGIPRGMEEI